MEISTYHATSTSKSRIARRMAWIVGAVALLVVLAALLVPAIARRAIEEQGSRALGHALTVEAVSFNPLTLTAEIKNISVADADKAAPPLLSIPQLTVGLSWASIWHMAPVLSRLKIVAPRFNIVRLTPDKFNISAVVDKLLTPSDPNNPPRFSVSNITIHDGTIAFDDQPLKKSHRINTIEFGIPFISNLPRDVAIHVVPTFSANVNGTVFKFKGKTLPFSASLESTFELVARDLDVPTYLAYLPALPVNVTAGTLDVNATISYHKASASTPQRLHVTGGATMRKFAMNDASAKPLLSFDSLTVSNADLTPLAAQARYALGNIAFSKPIVHLARGTNGGINWATPGANPGTKSGSNLGQSATTKTDKLATTWRADKFSIDGGTLAWSDATKALGGVPFLATLRDVKLSLDEIDSLKPEAMSAATLSLLGSDGESVNVEGKVALLASEPSAAVADVRVAAKGLRPQPYRAYWQSRVNALIEGGKLNLDTTLKLNRATAPGSDVAWQLSDGELELGKSRVFAGKERKTPIAQTETLRAKGVNINSAARSARVASIDATALNVNLRKSTGNWNFVEILVPSSAPSAANNAPWTGELTNLAMTGGISVRDESGSKPFRINASAMTLAASGLSNVKSAKAAINLQTNVNRRGRLTLTGSVTPHAKRGDLQVDARELDLAAINALTTRWLNVELASGVLTYRGVVSFNAGDAAKPVDARVTGQALVADFLALDKVNGAEFAKWKTLAFDGIDARVGNGPAVINIGGVALDGYYARLILNANGRLNLQDLLIKADAPAANISLTTPVPAPATPVVSTAKTTTVTSVAKPDDGDRPIYRVGKVTLTGGNINFSDNFVRPNYSANLTDMTGTLSAVASDAPAPAQITLRGRVDGDAAVAIDGRVNPLAKPLFLDVAGSAKGIELTRLSPYFAKYAGYAIEKGKMSVEIKYFVENNKFTAENRVFLDQLTFGDAVDSPDATKLPVRLAVALLKNSRGEIDVNLPITGSIDDPQFSVGGIIVRLIVNLLTKAIASPFALLGAAFDGGSADEMRVVEFAPGSAALDDAARKKLDTLARALKDRPALKLDITGRVDPKRDADGSRRASLAAAIRAQKLKQLVARGRSVNLDSITVTPEEYPKLLEAAYKDAKFPKPRNVLGLAKSLPAEEMETLMLTNSVFGENEQRSLANKRVDVVREVLHAVLGDRLVERVFVIAPKLTTAGLKESDNAARVEFGLRH